MSVTVPLTKVITAHGKELTELVMREPTADDLMDLGYPFLVIAADGAKDETKVELRPKVTGKYIVRLAAIPPSSVSQLAIVDLQAVQGVVMGFFGRSEDGEASTSSSQIASTSPTSGA